MFYDNNEANLLIELNDICKKLDDYGDLNKLTNKKIELMLKVLSSSAFKRSLYYWGTSHPKDLICIYEACKTTDGFILTYGSAILNGLYFDFCDRFLDIARISCNHTFNIQDRRTNDELCISLQDLCEHLTKEDMTEYKSSICVTSDDAFTEIPLLSNTFKRLNGTVIHGYLQIDPLLKSSLTSTIDELFIITNSNSANGCSNTNNVVNLFDTRPMQIVK